MHSQASKLTNHLSLSPPSPFVTSLLLFLFCLSFYPLSLLYFDFSEIYQRQFSYKVGLSRKENSE